MRAILTILLLLFSSLSFGQWNWPVQTNTFMEPFANNYLSYFSDQNNHLQILVTLTDQNATAVPAKLKIRMEGNGWWIETKPEPNSIPPLELEPFVSNIITGIDLQPYFFESNLNKSDASLDLNNLPEGQVELCVEVYGIGGTLTTIGGNQCTYFNIERLQPPQFFPMACGTTLDTNLMFHTFQWTPATGFSPLIGAEIEYTFSLYEVVDPNNYAIQVSNQIGLIHQEVTPFQTIQINLFDLNLQVGKKYIWQVRAIVYDNGVPRQMVDNDGFSEICEFHFGEAQSLEETLVDGLEIVLNAQANTQYKGTASWTVTDNTPNTGLSTYERYFVEYRLQPDAQHPNPTWHYDTVIALNKLIYQLAPESTYEVRVSGMAGSFTSDPTPVVSFTTPAAIDYVCGDEQIPFRPSQFTPNENIQVGDQVQIGQFLMNITEAIPQYEPGRYGGQGWIPVEFLGGARANVVFENILIDNEYVVRDGRVDVTTDGVDVWLEEQLQEFVDPIYVNGTVDSAWVDTTTNTAWVVVDGETIPFTFDPPDYPIVIHDDSGMSWTIWPNGTITVEGYLDPSNDYLDVSADSVAIFAQNDSEVYGFDAKEHMAWHENYEIILLPDSTYYFVPNKSIGKDASDIVDVTIPFNGTPVFKLDDQFTLSFSPSGGGSGGGSTPNSPQNETTYTVAIPTISSQGRHEIYVYNDLNQRVGKLNVHVYKQKDRELIVVPIANTSIDATQLKAQLDETLKEANLEISVTVAPQWNDALFTPTKTIALPENLSLMTDYSQDMRDLRDAYFEDSSNAKNNNAYYLFVIPQFDDANADGYMVKGKALGFVTGNDYQVYAHELAHGMGGLDHTWKWNGPDQGTTDNLMDYSANSGNVNLTKAQWKELQDLDLAPSLWDGVDDFLYGFDEAIPFYNDEVLYDWITPEQAAMGFVFLNGHRYKFRPQDNVRRVCFDKFGRVYGFHTDTEIYRAFVTRGSISGDYQCYFYINQADYQTYRNKIYDSNSTLHEAEWNYLQAHKYQFQDCPVDSECFRRSIIYRHSGIASAPNIWTNESCYVEDVFLNPFHTPVSTYAAGIYLGPSFQLNNFSVIHGAEEECWFPPEVTNLDHSGAGAIIFYELSKDIDTIPGALTELVNLANHFSEISADRVRQFYDYETNAYANFGVNNVSAGSNLYYNEPTLIPEVFRREGIYTLQAFHEAFPTSEWFFAYEGDSIVSSANIRSDIPTGYNLSSIDYLSTPIPNGWDPYDLEQANMALGYFLSLRNNYNHAISLHPELEQDDRFEWAKNFIDNFLEDPLGNLSSDPLYSNKLLMREYIIHTLTIFGWFDNYDYRMADLIQREIHRRSGGSFFSQITEREAKGTAYPLTLATESAQYMAHFNTTSAFFNGISYLDAALGLTDAAMGQGALQYRNRLSGVRNSFRIQYKNMLSWKSGGNNGNHLATMFKNQTGIDATPSVDKNLLNSVEGWQGSGSYPGIDNWLIVEIPAGTSVIGGVPGQSEFYSVKNTLFDVNYNKVDYWNSLQVSPHPQFGYRQKVAEYTTNEPMKVAISKTLANPQHGNGGAWQVYIEDYSTNITFVKEITLQ